MNSICIYFSFAFCIWHLGSGVVYSAFCFFSWMAFFSIQGILILRHLGGFGLNVVSSVEVTVQILK